MVHFFLESLSELLEFFIDEFPFQIAVQFAYDSMFIAPSVEVAITSESKKEVESPSYLKNNGYPFRRSGNVYFKSVHSSLHITWRKRGKLLDTFESMVRMGDREHGIILASQFPAELHRWLVCRESVDRTNMSKISSFRKNLFHKCPFIVRITHYFLSMSDVIRIIQEILTQMSIIEIHEARTELFPVREKMFFRDMESIFLEFLNLEKDFLTSRRLNSIQDFKYPPLELSGIAGQVGRFRIIRVVRRREFYSFY